MLPVIDLNTFQNQFLFIPSSSSIRPAVQAGSEICPQEAQGVPRQPDSGAGRNHVQERPQPGAFLQPEQLWRGGECLHRQWPSLLGGFNWGEHMVSFIDPHISSQKESV